jgi:hypothetical protein
VLVSVVVVALVWILLVKPSTPSPPCPPQRQCSNPPAPEPPAREPPPRTEMQSAEPYMPGRRWTSRVGVTLRYDVKVWRLLHADHDELRLLTTTADEERLWVTVRAIPSAEMSPLELLQDQLAREERDKLGVEADSAPSHALLEPSIGFVKAHEVTGVYSGTLDAPAGPSIQVEFVLAATANGTATVLVEALTDSGPATPDNGASSPYPIFQRADILLTTFEWPSA